jgi:protein SCO1
MTEGTGRSPALVKPQYLEPKPMSGPFSLSFGGCQHADPCHARYPVVALAAMMLLIVGCGGGTMSQTGTSAGQSAASSAKYAGVAASPIKPAPPLALQDSLGRQVNLDQYRGKAVLVTFIYDHCPDVCPIIVGNLHTAQAQLGPEANQLQIVAVSVDPKGDTPKTVKAFLAAHRMTGRMEYLLGSQPQLEGVWHAWNILSKATPEKGNPDLVEHSALVYGISGSGKLTTLYPQNFRPAQIVHDVPILASE